MAFRASERRRYVNMADHEASGASATGCALEPERLKAHLPRAALHRPRRRCSDWADRSGVPNGQRTSTPMSRCSTAPSPTSGSCSRPRKARPDDQAALEERCRCARQATSRLQRVAVIRDPRGARGQSTRARPRGADQESRSVPWLPMGLRDPPHTRLANAARRSGLEVRRSAPSRADGLPALVVNPESWSERLAAAAASQPRQTCAASLTALHGDSIRTPAGRICSYQPVSPPSFGTRSSQRRSSAVSRPDSWRERQRQRASWRERSHRLGPRRNPAPLHDQLRAISDELVEAELFGHTRGAFTGAMAERAGLFEEADSGTLFLDEVGSCPDALKAKPLRVLQDGEVRRVGETCRAALTRASSRRPIDRSNRKSRAADSGRPAVSGST